MNVRMIVTFIIDELVNFMSLVTVDHPFWSCGKYQSTDEFAMGEAKLSDINDIYHSLLRRLARRFQRTSLQCRLLYVDWRPHTERVPEDNSGP